MSRLSSLGEDMSGSSYDFTHSFAYNPASQIASVTRSNDAYAWGGHYNVNRAYTNNGLNQVTAAGETSLGYDGRGNLNASGGTSYTYTAENRLVTGPGANFLVYEPGGNQLLQESDWTTDTRFAWSGDRMISEISASTWAITRRYVPGPGTDETVVWYEGSGTSDRRWLHADERGSIVAVSNASGSVTAVNSYDEYGIPASGNVGRFQYTGQAWLPNFGIYYYKARMYSPTLGRFMQTDPIGYGGGANLYNYVGGDPVSQTDSSGLLPDKGWWRCYGNCASEGYLNSGLWPVTSRGSIIVGDSLGATSHGLQDSSRARSNQTGGRGCSGDGGEILVCKDLRVNSGEIAQLPVLNHESLYYHYNYGDGIPIHLTESQFNGVASKAKPFGSHLNVKPNGNYQQSIRLYGSDYGWMFGTATGFFDKNGKMIGFRDIFDLDWKYNQRSFMAEVGTRVGSVISYIFTLGGSRPYEVVYP